MKSKLTLGLITLFLFSATSALATDQVQATGQTRINTRSAASGDARMPTATCNRAVNHLDQTIHNYQTRKDLHVAVYQRQLTRWLNLATALQADGHNVDQLKTDLATLKEQVDALAADYQTFVTSLEDLKKNACNLSADELRGQMATTRTRLQSFRAQSLRIHNFIRTTIRADLLRLRNQLAPTRIITPTLSPSPIN